MKNTFRNLLVVHDKSIDSEHYRALSDHNWELLSAHDLASAEDMTKRHEFSVGLWLLKQTNTASDIEDVIRLFKAAPRINWVLGLIRDDDSLSISLEESKLIADFCFDYLIFPVGIDRLSFAVGHAYGMAQISLNLETGLCGMGKKYGIVGNSPPIRTLLRQISKVAKENYAVLIEGETGTGKELVATAIHANSNRADKPLITINCGGIPQDLIQSELFGYEKGAFTGAYQRKIGRIESAHRGTLFLDEIGDLPFSQQVNLLRFLEEKALERVGGTEKIPVDVRIIAATHVDLKKAVADKLFREDLYYRLRVLQIKTPRLAERGHDIELLALHFFEQFASGVKRKPNGFTTEALYLLRRYDWPGNIRELMNCIRNAVIMSENRALTPSDLGFEGGGGTAQVKPLGVARADVERELIIQSIENSRFNMSRAANDLGISRCSLYRLIEKHKLKF